MTTQDDTDQSQNQNHTAATPSTGTPIAVPQDQADAGYDSALPRTTDSPETLDEDLSQGATAVDEIREGESLVPKLPQDNQPPFSTPTDPVSDVAEPLDARTRHDRLDDTHPVTDAASDIDSQQLYDEGLEGAAEAGR